jgi:RNA polymerase sigma factor (sigma-70 family)
MTTTDRLIQELIRKATDERVRAALVEVGKKGIVERIAKEYVRAGVELDDLLQESAIALMATLKEWMPEGGMSLETLAACRIRNACRDFLVGVSSTKFVSFVEADDEGASPHDVVGEEPQQDEVVERGEEIDAVRQALDTLPVADRRILRTWATVHVDDTERGDVAGRGGAVPTVARELGIPRETARNRCRSALKRLGREVSPFVSRNVRTAA